MKFSEDIVGDDSEVNLNITPLIDIIFLLLIFFMLTTSFSEQTSIKVNLPKSSSTPKEGKIEVAKISVTADGKVYLSDKVVDLPELRKSLASKIKKSPSLSVVVRADENVNHGKIVSVLDQAKLSGVKKIAVATLAK